MKRILSGNLSLIKKKKKRSFLSTSNDDRSRLSLLKGSGLCVGLFLVPDYPILAATEGRFCQKRKSICRNLLLLCCFLSQAPANFSVQCLHSIIEYIHTRCSFLLLHITLTTQYLRIIFSSNVACKFRTDRKKTRDYILLSYAMNTFTPVKVQRKGAAHYSIETVSYFFV